MCAPAGGPMVRKHLLENGVTVLVDEMQDVRSFSLGFFVRAGSGEESSGKRGISDRKSVV